MELKPGFSIKLLQSVEEDGIFIPKGDVVEVVDANNGKITVRDIMDEKVTLPRGIKFKILQTQPKGFKLTAAPKATNPFIDQPYQPKLRAIQLAQVAASNALVLDDPIAVSRLALAGSILAMSLSPGLDLNQYSRLYQYAKKLIASI